MATETTEKQFVSNYLQLVSLSNDADSSAFNRTGDYTTLESLGPSLPTLKAKLPSNTKQVQQVKLTFKSIKPPYKFQTELTQVANTESIFSAKSLLIDSLDDLKNSSIKPSDLKFLLKGKVIQDNVILSSLDNYNFMCMVAPPASSQSPSSSPAPASTETKSIGNTQNDDPDINIDEVADLKVEPETFDKIYTILKQDLKNDVKALTILEKFKASI